MSGDPSVTCQDVAEAESLVDLFGVARPTTLAVVR